MNTIVAAVDRSDESGAALRFAIGEAGLRGTRVLLICPREMPVSLFAGRASRAVDPRSFEQIAEQTVENALTQAHRLDPDIPCECRAIHGRRASVLVAAADRDDLLVLGRCGRGFGVGRLFGSGLDQIIQRARCPVVIVPVAAA